MQKKVVATIMAAVLTVLTISGCSKSTAQSDTGVNDGNTQNETVQHEDTEDNSDEDAGTLADGQISLTFMLHAADRLSEPTFSAIWDGFEEAHPEIAMEYIGNSGTEEQMKKVKLGAESDSLPDIFWCSAATAKEMAEAGYLLNLNDYMEKSTSASAISKKLIESFYLDNTLYGLPYQCQIKGFWVNKAVFEENGLTPPTQGTTYKELLEMVDVLHGNGVTTFMNGAKTPYSCWAFLVSWTRYDYYTHVTDILQGNDTFENPDFIKYFEKLRELWEHGAFSENITTTDYDQAVEYFSSGKAAILDSGSWAAGSESIAKLGDKIDFWWGPVFEDGVGDQKISMQIPSSPLCVRASIVDEPEKLEAVYTFLDYYYGQEAAQICIDTGSVPVVEFDGEIKSDNPAFTAMMAAAYEEGWASPAAAPEAVVPSAVQSALYDAVYGVMSGIYTPEQALQQIDLVQQQ